MVLQVAAGDGQPSSRQSVRQSLTGEIPAYVDCQTNIMRLTKQVAQIVQEMVSLLAANIFIYCQIIVELPQHNICCLMCLMFVLCFHPNVNVLFCCCTML